MLKYFFLNNLSLSNFLNLNNIIVDGGAATGEYTKIFLKNNPLAKVYCYEPLLENFLILKNIKSNNLILKNVGLSDYNKQVSFALSYRNPIDGTSNVGRIVSDKYSLPHIKISVVNLDSEINSSISLLKLDLQAHEFEALVGAKNLLTQNKIDRLWIEFVGDYRVLDFLEKFDFMFSPCDFMLITDDIDKIKNINLEVLKIGQTTTKKNIITYKAPVFTDYFDFKLKYQKLENYIKINKLGFFFTDFFLIKKNLI